MALTVALLAGAALVAVWVGYPVTLWLLPRWPFGPPRKDRTDGHPKVSVIIATRDPVTNIVDRVADIRQTVYPHERIEIVVGVDRAALAPPESYASALGDCAVVIAGDPPGGKACTLNAAVRGAGGDLFVFTDSAQRFTAHTIPALVDAFRTGDVGAVSGRYEMATAASIVQRYWRYELFVRRMEARVHSIVGVTGAVYALRASLWRPLPAGLILDDVLVPLHAVRAGTRVMYSDLAVAHETRDFSPDDEYRRRVRTLTGVLQLCIWSPWILVPWHNPIAMQFWMHKLGRIATPILATAVLLGLLLAAAPPVALAATAGVAILAATLRYGTAHPRRVVLPLRLLLIAPLSALGNALRSRWGIW